jgi:hypothetical protein
MKSFKGARSLLIAGVALVAAIATLTDGGNLPKAHAWTMQQCFMFRIMCQRRWGLYTPQYLQCVAITRCPFY